MPTITVAADRHTVVSTGWTNPGNAYVDNTNTATALNGSTTKNISHSGDFGFPAVSTGQIPDGSTIDAVRLVVRGYLSASNITGGTLGIEPHNPAGTSGGSEATTTSATTATDLVSSFSTLPTLANLRTAGQVRARARGTKGNSSSGLTVYAEYVFMEIDYTEPSSGETHELAASVAGAGAASGTSSQYTGVAGSATGAATAEANLTVSTPIGTVPVWVSPADTVQIDTEPVLVFTMPDLGEDMYFHLQLDTANTFDSGDLRQHRTDVSQTGWEFHDGSDWQPVPSTGVPSTYAGNDARFTVSTPLSAATWYRRVRAGV
jgi:hypothetical protein